MDLKRMILPSLLITITISAVVAWYYFRGQSVKTETITVVQEQSNKVSAEDNILNSKTEILDPKTVFGKLDTKPLYRYLRLDQEGETYFDRDILPELLTQVVRGMKIKEGALYYRYKISNNLIKLSLRWVYFLQSSIINYTILLKRN